MMREYPVRFCERLKVKILHPTRLVTLCKTQAQAQEALDFISSLLKEMGLEVNQEKTRICRFSQGFDFLGFHISSRGVTMRKKSVEKFKETIRKTTKRSHSINRTSKAYYSWETRCRKFAHKKYKIPLKKIPT